MPASAQVLGKNCIGPWALATDTPSMRPMALSTKLIAASTSQAIPVLAAAWW